MATSKYALKGRIVTMDKERTVIPSGVVWIDEKTIIRVTASSADRPPDFETAEVKETGGTIFPGLIELHNHLAYNALALWKVPDAFTNRDQWGRRPDYKQLVSRPLKVLGSEPEYVAAIARYVEAKCLMGGVTASQGITLQSFSTKRYFKGLVRNVDQSLDRCLPNALTKIGDPQNADEVRRLATQLGAISCTLRHLSEGIDETARKKFLMLQYEPGKWALAPSFCGIHANGLLDEDLEVMQQHGAAIVWSPLSNLLLYGKTTNIKRAAELGIRIALGSDWSPTGSRNLLGELKIARAQAAIEQAEFDSAEIVAMVTSNPAQILGWDKLLGSIEAGKYADLVVIEGLSDAVYDQLIDADETKLRAVVIAGRVRLADPALGLIAAADAEPVQVGAVEKYVDVRDADADPLVDGLSLAASVARLKDGLARLPEIEVDLTHRAIAGAFNFHTSPARVWFLALEEEEEHEAPEQELRTLAHGIAAPGLGPPILRDMDLTPVIARADARRLPLIPLPLDPLTIAGDASYKPALLSQLNLPQTIKEAISIAFA